MILRRLNQSKALHFAADRLGGRAAINRVLRSLPVVRTLPRTGVRYRFSYLDSIAVAAEVFDERIYAASVPPNLTTFCDLGSNAGYFVAYLAEATENRNLRGIAIDADEDMVTETRWLVRNNDLRGVTALHGLVDARPGPAPRDFYVNACKMKSSSFTTPEPGQPTKDAWRRTRVAVVDVEAAWLQAVGDVRCDLLKVDIEGSERGFIRADNPFLRRVDRLVLEIHKWLVSPADIEAELGALSFRRVAVLRDSPTASIHLYASARLPLS